MFEISDSIPPPPTVGRPSKYPFRQLQIGQSFRVDSTKVASVPVSYWRLATGFSLTARKVVEDGVIAVRVWRTA